jgi:hypothetical protein
VFRSRVTKIVPHRNETWGEQPVAVQMYNPSVLHSRQTGYQSIMDPDQPGSG